MKKYILTLVTTTLFFGFSFSQDLTKPKGGGILDIVTIIPSDGYSDMIFEGQVGGYGSVCVACEVACINR